MEITRIDLAGNLIDLSEEDLHDLMTIVQMGPL
jgi:hypothetical protein